MESKTVTFAIGRGVETALLPKHLTTAQEMAEQLERQLKDIQVGFSSPVYGFASTCIRGVLEIPSYQ